MFKTFISKLITLMTIGIFGLPIVSFANVAEVSEPPAQLNLNLPAGFQVNIFAKLKGGGADFFTGPRMLAFDKKGNLFVSLGKYNQVIMLPVNHKNGLAEAPVLVSDKLNSPNGLAFSGDDLLVANQDGVVKLTQENGLWSAPKPFISNLPSGGHTLKTIKIGPDGFLYLNVGSSCNVCREEDPLRSTILRYTLEGKPAGGLETVGRHAEIGRAHV
jgi:glucose/arabinose dehydrogenase